MKCLAFMTMVLTISVLAVSTIGVDAFAAEVRTRDLFPMQTSAGFEDSFGWKVSPHPSTVSGWPISMAADQRALLDALNEARSAGDEMRARELHSELGWSAPSAPGQITGGRPAVRVIREELVGKGLRWDEDIRVSDPDVADDHPEIASRADGTLYVVCDDVDLRNYLDVYESTDHGFTWNYWFSLMGHEDNLTNASAVIAEGNAPELLIAYEQAQGTNHCELWVYISYLGTQIGNLALIDSYPLDHKNPRICVDYPEYDYWYPYIVYVSEVAGEPDYWQIRFRRSFDYGVTWTNAEVLATVFNTGDYGPRPDIDFGDSGLYVVYDRSDPATEKRDVFLRRSTNLGGTWDPEVGLATTVWDESAPCVAATNGGGAVVVAYDRLYEGSPDQYDIELFYSTDSGSSWSWSYLPYDNTDEWGLDLCTSPSFGKVHASFYRFGDIIYTWADHASPWSWASATDINEGSYASGASATSITVNPTKEEEACIAWGDTRTWNYEIYFDALYPIGPSTGVTESVSPPGSSGLRAYPEPVRMGTTLLLRISRPGRSQITIHDSSGRLVRTLLDQWVPTGSLQLEWDGCNKQGMRVAAGSYYLCLEQDERRVHTRCTVIR